MGNAAYTCKLGKETGVVNQKQTLTITIENNSDNPMKQPDSVAVGVEDPDKAQVTCNEEGALVQEASSRKFTFAWTPTRAGYHTVITTPVYPAGSSEKASPSKHLVQIFKSPEDEQGYIQKKEREEAEKKRKKIEDELRQAEMDAEAKASGGIFSLKPKYKSFSEIPEGTSMTVVKHAKDGGPTTVKIGMQQYTIEVGDKVTIDAERVQQIEEKLARFASFPEEEARRPEKSWPPSLTLAQVFEGACEMSDPYAIKQCLARGVDPNKPFNGRTTALAKMADSGLAKRPEEWKTHHGVSRNWSATDSNGVKFSTYRQSKESDALACAVLLLQAGAKKGDDVVKELAKENFFAKGVPKTRMNKVIDSFHGPDACPDLDWTKAFPLLERFSTDAQAEWPPAELLPKKEEASAGAGAGDSEAKEGKASSTFSMHQDAAAALFDEITSLKNEVTPSKKTLEQLWTCYDKDKNGVLDSKECFHLLQDLLAWSKNQLFNVLKTNPIFGEEQAFKMVSAQFESREKDLQSEGAVQRLLAKLDKDSDGRVDKDEFLAGAGTFLFADDLFQ